MRPRGCGHEVEEAGEVAATRLRPRGCGHEAEEAGEHSPRRGQTAARTARGEDRPWRGQPVATRRLHSDGTAPTTPTTRHNANAPTESGHAAAQRARVTGSPPERWIPTDRHKGAPYGESHVLLLHTRGRAPVPPSPPPSPPSPAPPSLTLRAAPRSLAPLSLAASATPAHIHTQSPPPHHSTRPSGPPTHRGRTHRGAAAAAAPVPTGTARRSRH